MRSTFALAAGTISIASLAAADSTSMHATATGDVAVTDNVFAAPENREGDLFFQIRPGLLYTYAAPRMIHDLNAEGEVIQYAFHSRDPSLSGRGGWRGFFIPGPRSEMILAASAGTGLLSAIGSRLTPDQTMINVTPVGKVTTRQAEGSEYFSYIATRELRLSQNLFARYSDSDDNADETAMAEATRTESGEAGATLSLERAWRKDSLSIEVGASVQRLERVGPEGPLTGDRLERSTNPRGRVQWRHDIDRRLSFSLDGGLVYVMPYGKDPYNPDEDRQAGLFPVAGGMFAITEQWGRGQLSLRRDVLPNMFIAQNTVNDSATISAALPLPWFDDSGRRSPKMVALGSVGVQRTQLIEAESGDLTSSIGAARVDVGVLYTPRPGISYGVRYELMVQTGDDSAVDPLGNTMPIEGFFRNTVYFTFAVRYPDRVAATVPKRRAGNAVRADRKDMVPIGAEPVIPDLLEGGEEGDER